MAFVLHVPLVGHFSGVSASAALTVSAADRAGVRAASSAVSTITFAIIRANAESGEAPPPLPGVAMRRAALGAIGVTAESAAGVANDRGSPCGVSGSGAERGSIAAGAETVAAIGDRRSERPRRVSTELGVARATASATAAVGDTPSASHASRAAFPGEGPGPEVCGSAVGVGSDGSIVAGESISDVTSEDGDAFATATRVGGVPSTLAEATLAVRDSAVALAPRLGDLGGLCDRGLAERTGVSDARTESWRISIAAAASFAASASSSATRLSSAASAATALSSAANSELGVSWCCSTRAVKGVAPRADGTDAEGMAFASAPVVVGVRATPELAALFALALIDASVRGLGDRRIASSLSIAASQCFSAGDGPTMGVGGVALSVAGDCTGAIAGFDACASAVDVTAAGAAVAGGGDFGVFVFIFSSSFFFAAARSSLGRACLLIPCSRKLSASSNLPLCSSRTARLSQYAACVALGSVFRTAAGPSSSRAPDAPPGVLGARETMSALYRFGVFAPASTAMRAGACENIEPPGVLVPAPGVRDAAARRAGVVVMDVAGVVTKTLFGRDECDASIPGVRPGVLANCAIFAAAGVFIPAFETPRFSGDVTLCLALGLLFQALGVRAVLAAGVLTRPGVFKMPRPGVTAGAGYALCVATFSSSSMCTDEGGSHLMLPCDRPRPGVDIARGGGGDASERARRLSALSEHENAQSSPFRDSAFCVTAFAVVSCVLK